LIATYGFKHQIFFEENRRGSGASTENLLKTTKKVATKQNQPSTNFSTGSPDFNRKSWHRENSSIVDWTIKDALSSPQLYSMLRCFNLEPV
jgi:hypothetical protein